MPKFGVDVALTADGEVIAVTEVVAHLCIGNGVAATDDEDAALVLGLRRERQAVTRSAAANTSSLLCIDSWSFLHAWVSTARARRSSHAAGVSARVPNDLRGADGVSGRRARLLNAGDPPEWRRSARGRAPAPRGRRAARRQALKVASHPDAHAWHPKCSRRRHALAARARSAPRRVIAVGRRTERHPGAADEPRPPELTCASKPGERTQCAADTSKGVVLVQSTGDAPCLLGRTWGYDQTSVWVSDGCSAVFATGPAVAPETTKPKPLSHVPNVGFLLFDGEKGQVYFRLFSYARYLNQRNLDESYVDAFGVAHTVVRRQDIQLQKFFAPFSGWFLTPKMRYYLYVWSSNSSQGDPAQVVGAGNLTWSFNRHVSVGAGITSLPVGAKHRGPVPVLARRGRSPDRRRVLPRVVHLRRLAQRRVPHQGQVPWRCSPTT